MIRFVLLFGLALGLAHPAMAQRPVAGEGEMCAGFAGIGCARGLTCDRRPGLCRGADISGTCFRASDICTREYRPVCGCDGRTYSNDCERRREHAAKNHDGPCAR